MKSEFQRLIEVFKIGDGSEEHVWKATAAECLNLEKRLGLKKLHFFTVQCSIKRLKNRKDIEVHGKIHASLIQECCFSLEDVPDTIQDNFNIYLRPYHDHKSETEELILEEEDIIEFKPLDQIDLGDIAVQYLSLAMNPYPRSGNI